MAYSRLVFIVLTASALVLIGEAAKVRVKLAAGTTHANGSNLTVTRALEDCNTDHCDICVDLCTLCSQSGRTCSGCICDHDGGCDYCECGCS